MRELVPQAVLIGVLTSPTAITTAGNMTDLRAAAGRVGQEVVTLEASTANDIDAAFTTAANRNFGALLIDVSSFFSDRREQIVTLAARHGIAAIYPERVFSEAGGLMSYGASPVTRYRQAGIYVGRILKGEKPSDLPVVQPTKFEFVINLKTAKTLGLQIPDRLLELADEVIE
jgi:putative ABC transport system substrate-binding protein